MNDYPSRIGTWKPFTPVGARGSKPRHFCALGTGLAVALASIPGFAQSLAVQPYLVPGGGGQSSGSRFSVSGSIGMSIAASAPRTGDSYGGRAGFWSQILRWVNAPPRATNDAVARRPGEGAHVLIRQLLRNDADPDFDKLALVDFDATSQRGGSIFRDGPWLVYQPPAGAAPGDTDSFGYRISDGEASPVSGTILVGPFIPSNSGPPNALSIVVEPGPPRLVRLRFQGIAGRTYLVQTSEDPAGPWSTVATLPAGVGGAVVHSETPRTDPRFYRLAEP
ncbi:MAG: cadherin-like domain-containing protein [Verrucomicrobiales bacterium]|nr:cadherin-like domain-containing protein [Verrucomicrobiales bacterium]